jgi:hypothetical protein
MKMKAAFVCATLFASAASAQDCSMEQIASLSIAPQPDGTIAVPADVNGKHVLLAVAMQAPHTALNADYVRQAGMEALGTGVQLRQLGLGHFSFDDVGVATIASSPAGTAGVLGIDTLREYDVEIDFKSAKLNLFAKQHCTGNVVYWTNSYTVVPFSVDAGGRVVAQMALDGKPVSVAVSTAPGHLAMRSMSTPAAYKTLGIGAISLSNPQVASANDVDPGADMRIGLDDLKMLHLFFAFSENKLYVTP